MSTTPTWHDKLVGGFKRTSDRLVGNLAGLGGARLDDETLDGIEEALIASDLGPETATRIRERLAEGSFERNMEELGIRLVVAEEVERALAKVARPLEIEAFPRPQVILVIGVNGSGKTTTIAKLAHLFMEQDYGVMLAAGDTFRAAAIGQLATWAERVGVPIVSGKEGGDAAGIVYEAVRQATATGIDVLIVDTAGRLQNKRELMDELSKIRRVLGRLNPASPHDVVLVLDATTGQNALSQIEVFRDVAGVTGLVMTKLDGTARAGRGGRAVRAADPRDRRGRDDRGPATLRRQRGEPDHCGCRGRAEVSVGPSIADDAGKRAAELTGGSPGVRLFVDYAPLVVFFAVNFLVPASVSMRLVAATSGFLSDLDRMSALVIARVIVATVAFVIATVAAMIVSQVKLGRISPMLWLAGGLVVVFGGLTVYFRDPRFIQMKPTIVYLAFAAVLAFGLLTGRPLLEGLLGTAYPGLTAEGWRKLTRNWAVFFVVMAVANEIVWRVLGWDIWVLYKLWVAIPVTLIFAAANVPMLLRHGLQVADDPIAAKPPEG